MLEKVNTTLNGTLQSGCAWNPIAEKNRESGCLLPDFSYFAGWEQRHRNNCLQDEDHEKTYQLFNRKYGHV